MSIATAHVNAPMGAITTYRLISAVEEFADKVVAWNEARETRKIISRLSAEQLDDIGLNRSDFL